MATVQHKDITDPYIHEPKGVSTATTGTVYKSTGAGSGAWEFESYILNAHVENISSAGSIWVVSPFAGTVSAIYSVITNAITVANNTVTPKIGGVAITGGGITITQAGSAAGDVDSSTPSAANSVTAGQAIEIAYTGSTTACKCTFTILIQRTA